MDGGRRSFGTRREWWKGLKAEQEEEEEESEEAEEEEEE